ncbi:DUF7666 domain-containing protein [Oscillibacter ruminantium]|uniref:DUF7666 domain-containing protein n=1 Tax=Oscillibacter ruminantium TaxID=1263547 RepID=UPI00332C680A
MSEEKIIAFKGMDKNMQCRGFQYEVGGEYETDSAEACKKGFHACEYPLDVFNYYPAAGNRFFAVEQSGDINRDGDDSKAASTKIKVNAEIGIPGLAKAAIEYTTSRAEPEKGGHATGTQGAASATGDRGAASATGYQGAASATGYQGAASATGEGSIAVASGYIGKAMGAIGCAICVCERGEWDGDTYPLIGVKAAIVDGKNIKPDTWYTLVDGEFAEASE